MTSRAGLAIIGVGQTACRRRHQGSTPELVHAAVQEALQHSGLGHRDIDMVIGGFAPDALAGENCPDKRFLPAAGAVGKWSMRVNTGGTTGIAAAYAAMDLLEAGHGDAALVVAVERMAQARSVPAVFNSIFDPVYERDTGLSTVSMGALRASRMMQRWGYTAPLWARVAERNFAHAALNPLAQIRIPHSADDVLASRMLAWPIRQLDACPISEGVCAVVIARTSAVGPGRRAAHVRGRATVTDTYNMGDRIGRPEGDLVEMLTLQLAAGRALGEAGLASASDADVVEIHAPFDHAETMAYAPLRFCAAADGPALVASGFGRHGTAGPVINPSGGPQAGNPVGATALIRLAECALQVMGDAGERQVPRARTAVATGQGGSTQFSTCTVLSAS
jgi:acetyl-CoA C-acetyltransferase